MNIVQFLRAENQTGEPVIFFNSVHELAVFTKKKGLMFPRDKAKAMGPVAALLKIIVGKTRP